MSGHNSAIQSLVITQRGTPRARRVPRLERVLESRYELKYLIGRGGMCEVHAAHDLLLERTVAIKMLKCELADSAHLERLRREAAAMARVESPHVVTIHDIGIDGDEIFLVMQHLHGLTLEEEIQRFGPMEPARACRLMGDLLTGLTAIHCHGLVHRDLKPSNIVLDRDDRAVLVDLGIALHRRKRSLTPPGMATGTPEFMAPEQLDAAPVDNRTDLYQAGRVLIYALTGLDAESDVELALQHMPAPLAEVARRALAPIDQRYTSADKMQAALTEAVRLLEPTPADLPAPSLESSPLRRIPAWTAWPILAMAPALLLALLAAASG